MDATGQLSFSPVGDEGGGGNHDAHHRRNGRVYQLTFQASDGRGGTCTGQVQVCVPRGRATTCVDDGQTVNSLGPCVRRHADVASLGAPRDFSVRATNSHAPELSFVAPQAGDVSLCIFDVSGRVIERIIDGKVESGSNSVVWNATDRPADVYFARLRANGNTLTRTIILH